MTRQFAFVSLALAVCLTVSLARGEQREKNEERSRGNESAAQRKPESSSPFGTSQGMNSAKSTGNSPVGGDWSERMHNGKTSSSQAGTMPAGAAAAGAASMNKASSPTAAEGAAAGKAYSDNKQPQATGAEGAAAGAAVANRNSPQYSGAQGAAAGAAAANHNSPQYSGAQGAAAGAAVANRNSPAFSGAAGATAGYAAVQNGFHDPGIYGAGWYGSNPGAWAATGWAAGAAWQPSTWNSVAGFCGYGATPPVSYNYGVNVTLQNGNVMVNGQNVGTPGLYSQQAATLAQTGTDAQAPGSDQWLPLGVFAMVRDENQQPEFIVQMAINKQGILRGNYTDENSGNTLPIHGAADKSTQRAAWMVGDSQAVMEAGLSDLTDSEAPALIHKNGKTDHWILIRLQKQVAQNGKAGN